MTLGRRFPAAVLAALAAALAGGVVWGLVAKTTGYEVGVVAWGIGFLAGTAAALVAPDSRGVPLQAAAILSALVGIFLGKYLTFAWDLQDFAAERGVDIGLFSDDMRAVFREDYDVVFDWFDVLWIGLAIFSAWRATAPPPPTPAAPPPPQAPAPPAAP